MNRLTSTVPCCCNARAQPCPTLRPQRYGPPGSSVHGTFQERTWRGCLALLQGIFPAQGSNSGLRCLLHALHTNSSPLEPSGECYVTFKWTCFCCEEILQTNLKIYKISEPVYPPRFHLRGHGAIFFAGTKFK